MDLNKKTIIFDFGNVLFDLNFEQCFKAFNKVLDVDWGFKNIPTEISKAIQKYDRGQISDEAFIWVFQQFNPNANPREIIHCWNAVLDNLPHERLDMLKKLREDYNIALLSNINNLHLLWIQDYITCRLEVENFEETFFDAVFYSHIIGMRKPDRIIYEHVTKELGASKKDILFIDDLPMNIEAAQEFGWHGQVHNPKNKIDQMIESYIDKCNWDI